MNDLWPPEPPRRRRIDWSTWLQVLLALVALAAAGWFIFREFQQPQVATGQARVTQPAPGPETTEAPSASNQRGEKILTCSAEDGSVFYTNASRCEDADLGNTVNVIPAHSNEVVEELNCITSNRDWETSVRFLGACQETFMQALALEKFLIKAEDPANSRRTNEYCGLIADGVSAGCMATDAVFCFLPVCQQRAIQGDRVP